MSDAQLIQQWSPIIYHHKNEQYFPCSFPWLMLYSTLIDYNTPEPTIISPITSDSLFNISRQYNFERHGDGDIIWSFSNELYPGQHPTSNVPIYAISKRVNQKLYITYFTLYAYNCDYNILNIAKTGSHPCDLEHIMLEIDPNTNTLLRVLFSSHTPKDGRWVDVKDIEFENNKVVAYAALYGHGLYPKQGMIIRLLGLANDYTSKDIRWEPKVEIAYHFGDPKFNASTMGWLVYYGRMGGSMKRGDTSGIMGLGDKIWIREMDSLNEHDYSPPIILSKKVGNIISIVLQIIGIVLLYVSVLKIFQFSAKYFPKLVYNPKSSVQVKYIKIHSLTIILFIVCFNLFRWFVIYLTNALVKN